MTHQNTKLPVTMKMWMQFNVMPRTNVVGSMDGWIDRWMYHYGLCTLNIRIMSIYCLKIMPTVDV